jgi:hypothetical protein
MCPPGLFWFFVCLDKDGLLNIFHMLGFTRDFEGQTDMLIQQQESSCLEEFDLKLFEIEKVIS